MTNLTTIENKISSVKKYLVILKDFKRYSRKQIENDVNIRGAAERYLYLAVQAVIDAAEAYISLKNFRKPTTLREGFEILEEEKIISAGSREKMAKLAGFRNLIAHDYEKINYDIVYDILQNRLSDIEEFIKTLKSEL